MHKAVSASLLLKTGLMTALTAIGGLIHVPAFPVAFTMQTFFVYLAGVILPGKWGAVSQLLYLCVGLAGLPVFSAGGGAAYILHPSFGFLLGFPAAAAFIGKHRPYSCTVKQLIVLFAAASGLVSAAGVGYLYLNLRYIAHAQIPFVKAVISGFLIFLPSEIVKISLAVLLSRKLMRTQLWIES